MSSVFDYINNFEEKIIHIYWDDNHGKRDEHLPIGEGLLNHVETVKALKCIDYDTAITLEVFTNSNDAKSSANKLGPSGQKNESGAGESREPLMIGKNSEILCECRL